MTLLLYNFTVDERTVATADESSSTREVEDEQIDELQVCSDLEEDNLSQVGTYIF